MLARMSSQDEPQASDHETFCRKRYLILLYMKSYPFLTMVTLLGALGIVYVVFYCLFSTDVVQKRQYDLEKDGVTTT